jgi:hypothetical protein
LLWVRSIASGGGLGKGHLVRAKFGLQKEFNVKLPPMGNALPLPAYFIHKLIGKNKETSRENQS